MLRPTTLLPLIALCLAPVAIPATQAAADDVFLGRLNANRLDPNSVSNPLGRYGSRLSPLSINNLLGRYGSPLSPTSPTNPFATNTPILIGK